MQHTAEMQKMQDYCKSRENEIEKLKGSLRIGFSRRQNLIKTMRQASHNLSNFLHNADMQKY